MLNTTPETADRLKKARGLVVTDITDEAAKHASFDHHEKVWLGSDRERGLTAIVAVHNSTLGPGCGGTRIWPYDSFDAALSDVLRLSRGMTFKSAIAGLALGGGKAVIIADSKKDKTPQLLEAYADMLNEIGGSYLTAEDVGMTLADADFIDSLSPFVMGTTRGGSGNPSSFTAHGVYLGVLTAWKHKTGSDSVEGVRIAVQGLGSVGGRVAEKLAGDGAKLVVADIDGDRAKKFATTFGADVTDTAGIIMADVDIVVPGALGAILNDETIPQIKASVIAGAANNQLAHHDDARKLMERGILYAPDYVINAGGIINVAMELDADGYDPIKAELRIANIPETLMAIFKRSDEQGIPTNEVSLEIASEIIAAAKRR